MRWLTISSQIDVVRSLQIQARATLDSSDSSGAEVVTVISTGWGPSMDTSIRCRARTLQWRDFHGFRHSTTLYFGLELLC